MNSENASPSPVEQVLREADEAMERGTKEWIAHVLKWAVVTLRDDGSFDQFHELANVMAQLYVRRTTVRKFAELVRDMRKSQKEYFRYKTGAWLERAKTDERLVDEWIASALAVPDKQRPLFPTDPPREPYR